MRTLPFGVLLVKHPDPANVMRLDHAILPALSAMERNGMPIDAGRIGTLRTRLIEEMGQLQTKVEDMTGYTDVNISSPDQLAELLFKRMELKQAGSKEKWTKSKTRLAVDSDVLKGMISQHAVVKVILDYSERKKLLGSFTTSLLAQADDNSRVHSEFNHCVAETGRLSCSNPNLMQIPTRTALGRLVRDAFVAPKGKILGTCDMSQVEMRHAAEDAKCPNLMRVFSDKDDLYWDYASRMYKRVFTKEDRKHGIDDDTGLSLKAVYRQNAKVAALGTIYDITPEGLVDQFLSFDAVRFLTDGDPVWNHDKYHERALANCTWAIQQFFEAYPELLTRRREHHRRAMRWGMSWCCFGRQRWIPQVKSVHRWIQQEGLRAAANHPIQGGCAGIMKLWVACVYKRIEEYWGKKGVEPLMVIHDEILTAAPKSVMEDFLPEAAGILKELLPPEFYATPLSSSYGMAESWGTLEK